MKQCFFIVIVLFLYSCNYPKTKQANTVISSDTLFERKVPVLTFNSKELQRELDSLVETEINCYYYKKNTTCFTIWRMPFWGVEDTMICISSGNSYDIDFSRDSIKDHPIGWRREDMVYGYFKYKGFSFFCYASCMKFTDLFYETTDSVKVKNSPLLYIEHEPEIDDSHTQWDYIYKNNKLIDKWKTTCKQ